MAILLLTAMIISNALEESLYRSHLILISLIIEMDGSVQISLC